MSSDNLACNETMVYMINFKCVFLLHLIEVMQYVKNIELPRIY